MSTQRMNCRYRRQHLLFVDIDKCGIVKSKLHKYTLGCRQRMYRPAEFPAVQPTYARAFRCFFWYSQSTWDVDITPLKVSLSAYNLIIFQLRINHLRNSIAIRRSTSHHIRDAPEQRQIILLEQTNTLTARCSRLKLFRG